MKKILHSFVLVIFVIWLVGVPILTSVPAGAQAETVERNTNKITGVTPASGSIINIYQPNVGASFSLSAGETYVGATIEVDGSNNTTNAAPSAAGFSYYPDLGQGNHQIKTTLFYNTSSGADYAIRIWSYTVDTIKPASGAQTMPNYTNNYQINVPVEGRDNISGFANTELWYKFDNDGNIFNDSWQLGPVAAGLPKSIYFDAGQRGGQGRFAFMTIATDNAGNKEVKSFHEEAWIIYDATTPKQISRDKIVIEKKAPGNQDAVYCLPGSVDDSTAKVVAYGDSALRTIIFKSPVYGLNGEKKCGAYGIGDNQYASIFVVSYDNAGNAGLATQVDNDFSIAQTPTNLRSTRISSSSILLSWVGPIGGDGYRIRYKKQGETTYSAFVELKPNLNTATISGLDQNTIYDFSVTTKDLHGSESTASVISASGQTQVATNQNVATTTKTTADDETTTTKPKSTTETTDESKKEISTEEKPTDKTAEEIAKDEAKKEETTKDKAESTTKTAENKATDQSKTSRNWTPWIVLAILIILAGAATGGYFYWFGGPEEITTTIKSEDDKKEKKENDDKTEDKDQEARW